MRRGAACLRTPREGFEPRAAGLEERPEVSSAAALEANPSLSALWYRNGMNNFYLRSVLGWGVLLWLIGYVLGFIFFAFVPVALIGWYVMPLGIVITCVVLSKWIFMDSVRSAVILGIGWSAIAIFCDYIFLVKLLSPADGYYKPDVYLYYILTLLLPLIVYRIKRGA